MMREYELAKALEENINRMFVGKEDVVENLLGVQMCQTVSDVFSLLLSIPLGLSVLAEMKQAEQSGQSARAE